MNGTGFENMTLLARIAYAVMCFERYATHKYPNKDMSAVSELMWKIIDSSDYIDNSAYRYMEIIPEYLFEAAKAVDLKLSVFTVDDIEALLRLVPVIDGNITTNLPLVARSILNKFGKQE